MAIEVIGAGMGRTGTLSIRAGLEQLGFNKCYHMAVVIKNAEHVAMWRAIHRGESVDWNALFDGYRATVDWPACMFYRELMEVYPNAKVLLAVRDPERWYESALRTIYASLDAPGPDPNIHDLPLLLDESIWHGTFHGQFEDKEKAIEIFQNHIEEVKKTVPTERLLVYEVKEGWTPLCRFLNVPIPEGIPFPHINDSAEFAKRLERWRKAGWPAR